jgi:integral membrane protein
MISSVIGRLRLTGFLEGLSFLILVGIAMPLKYLYDMPQAVRVIGMAHGILFILFIVLTLHATLFYKWPFWKMILLWIASILPFGTFYADYKLLRNNN